MGSYRNEFVLTDHIRKIFLVKNYKLRLECFRCKKPFLDGELIVSKASMSRTGKSSKRHKLGSGRRFYHKDCWNELFF